MPPKKAKAESGKKAGADAVPFPIVDTHVHFWDTKRLRYPWLDKSKLLNQPYLPEDYTEAVGPVEVERVVFVEAACQPDQARAEVQWVTKLAAEDPRIQGIVASAPLEHGSAVKDQLTTLALNPLVKGIRRFHQRGGRVPPEFVEGVRLLECIGFTCDVCAGHDKLPAVIELVRRCPGVQFMLDHIGAPDLRRHRLDPWRDHIQRLAKRPNVYCKMSGVATAADRAHWKPEDLKPAIDHVLDCFGFERTAFGSDWPVMLTATTYPRWVETLAGAVEDCTEAELRRLFHDTAVEFYRLTET